MRGLKAALASMAFLGLSGAAWAQSDHDHDHASKPDPASIEIDHAYTEAEDDHAMGSEIAPIEMIVYASVTCPHCGDWFTNDFPQLKADHIDSGNVRFIFREFPTAPAQVSMAGFMMANCAPQDAYFDHILYQMENQEKTFEDLRAGKAKDVFDNLGKMAGLNSDAEVNACFADMENFNRIDRAMKRAAKSGIEGVPSIVIDGKLYRGETDADTISEIFAEKLQNGVSVMPGQ